MTLSNAPPPFRHAAYFQRTSRSFSQSAGLCKHAPFSKNVEFTFETRLDDEWESNGRKRHNALPLTDGIIVTNEGKRTWIEFEPLLTLTCRVCLPLTKAIDCVVLVLWEFLLYSARRSNVWCVLKYS